MVWNMGKSAQTYNQVYWSIFTSRTYKLRSIIANWKWNDIDKAQKCNNGSEITSSTSGKGQNTLNSGFWHFWSQIGYFDHVPDKSTPWFFPYR